MKQRLLIYERNNCFLATLYFYEPNILKKDVHKMYYMCNFKMQIHVDFPTLKKTRGF